MKERKRKKEMEKDIKKEMEMEREREWEEFLYGQMVKSFIRYLYFYTNSGEYEKIKELSVDELEKWIVKAKDTRSVQEFFFMAGSVMAQQCGPEFRKRKGYPEAAFTAANRFMTLVGLGGKDVVLK
jgi:hypothetical protein